MSAADARIAVHGVDRGLNLIRPRLIAGEAAADQRLAFADQRAIPVTAILIGEPHEAAVRGHACGAPRVDQQHQREQPHDFRFAGHQIIQLPAKPDRFRAQIVTRQSLA